MKKLLISLLIAVMVISCAVACVACQAEDDGDAVKVINIKLTEEEYAFGVDKAQPELLTSANQVLADIKADGTFDAIISKYFNGEEVTGVTSGTKDIAKADKQLVVATSAAFAPFEYKIGDKFAGVDMEIAAIIAEKLGLELVIEDMEFDSVVTSVGKNGVDIAMAGLTVNEKRKEFVNFSDSYYNASQVLVVKADCTAFDACKTAADVEAILANGSLKVGVQSGTTGELYVKGDEDWGFDGFANIECKSFSNGGLAAKDMINGNVDYVIIDEAPANFIAKSLNA